MEKKKGNAKHAEGERRGRVEGIRTKRSMRYVHHNSSISTEIRRIWKKGNVARMRARCAPPPNFRGIYIFPANFWDKLCNYCVAIRAVFQCAMQKCIIVISL
jgi:hypothetical protein